MKDTTIQTLKELAVSGPEPSSTYALGQCALAAHILKEERIPLPPKRFQCVESGLDSLTLGQRNYSGLEELLLIQIWHKITVGTYPATSQSVLLKKNGVLGLIAELKEIAEKM